MPSTRSLIRPLAVLGTSPSRRTRHRVPRRHPPRAPHRPHLRPLQGVRASAPTAQPSASAGDAWLIVSDSTEPTLRVILDSTLENIFEPPVGAPRRHLGHVLTATPGDKTTRIQNLVVQPGFGGSTQDIDGRGGYRPSASTRSRVACRPTARDRPGRGRRSTAPLAATNRHFVSRSGWPPRAGQPAANHRAEGAFDYDALSPDGTLCTSPSRCPVRSRRATRSARSRRPRVGCATRSSSTSATSTKRWLAGQSTRRAAPTAS